MSRQSLLYRSKSILEEGRKSLFEAKQKIDEYIQEPPMPVPEMISILNSVYAIETIVGLIGFSPYLFRFLSNFTWYLDPIFKCMKNPNQPIINFHVMVGFTIIMLIWNQGRLIRLGGKKNLKQHAFIGTWVISLLSFVFLIAAGIAEFSLPSALPQKIGRTMLIPWCGICLFLSLYYAYKKEIRGHLVMICVFWGLCCSAGALRGMGLFIQRLFQCPTNGNPVPGIILGPLFSTTLPVFYFIIKTKSFHFSYGRWGMLLSTFYLWLFPLYPYYFFHPCIPREDYTKIYPDYPFYDRHFLEDKVLLQRMDFCEFRGFMNSVHIDNTVLSTSLQRNQLIQQISRRATRRTKMIFPEKKCFDNLPTDFMKLEFAVYDENRNNLIELSELKSYMHALSLPNKILTKAIDKPLEEGELKKLTRQADIENGY